MFRSSRVTSFLWDQLGYLSAVVLTGTIFWAINQPVPGFSTVVVYALSMGNLVVYPIHAVRRRLSETPAARRWSICIAVLLALTPVVYVLSSAIEAHGGQLWASNNAGRGATFHFTLPADTGAVNEESAVADGIHH